MNEVLAISVKPISPNFLSSEQARHEKSLHKILDYFKSLKTHDEKANAMKAFVLVWQNSIEAHEKELQSYDHELEILEKTVAHDQYSKNQLSKKVERVLEKAAKLKEQMKHAHPIEKLFFTQLKTNQTNDKKISKILSHYLVTADYTLKYVLNTPNPRWPDTVEMPEVWVEAIYEYLRRIGIKKPELLNKNKTLSQILQDAVGKKSAKDQELIFWSEVKRIFNLIAGHRKNRKRSPESQARKSKMNDLKNTIKTAASKEEDSRVRDLKLGDHLVLGPQKIDLLEDGDEVVEDTAAPTQPNYIQKVVGEEDLIPGGLADKKPFSDFDQDLINEGAKIEMEHTDDINIAKEIAKDHLAEDLDYYKKLKKIEAFSTVSTLTIGKSIIIAHNGNK